MEKLIQQNVNNLTEKKQINVNHIKMNVLKYGISILSLIIISFLILLPFVLSSSHSGVDYLYHLSAIQALNEAWHNGSFGSKIYEMICLDYGYGTGLFYSMIPSGITVILMNVLNISINSALYIELAFLYALSAIVVYIFMLRITKTNWIAFIVSVFYISFPYFYVNLYYRFAFSEMFFMLYIPLIFYSLYELVENNNYKIFIPLFTLSSSLALLTHIAILVYVALIVLVYLLFNIKKIIRDYTFVPFLISCFLILLISATFYIPMLVNYGTINISKMGRSMNDFWIGILVMYKPNSIMFTSVILNIVSFISFIIVFALNKEKSIIDKIFVVISTISLWVITPLFPWVIFPKFFGLIQFGHRLLMISSMITMLQIGYILKNLNKTVVKICIICVMIGFSALNFIYYNAFKFDKGNSAYDCAIASQSISGFDLNYGMGWNKYGDYLPKNATEDYIFTRANNPMICESNVQIKELVYLKNRYKIEFIITPNLDDCYVVFNLPYSVIENEKIYQISSNYDNFKFENVKIVEYEGKIKVVFEKTEQECKCIIQTYKNSAFDRYLKANPFEFVVREGEATFTNFNKNNSSSYSVEVNVTNKAVVELPTLYYKGYKITLTNVNGTETINPVLNDNGFVEVTLTQGGTLHVEFAPGYVTFANVLSIIGLVLFAIAMIVCLIVPRQKFANLANKTTEFFKTHKNVGEILRFIIVGGIATLIDMFTMGVVMYLMQKSIYTGFLNVFIGAPTPSTLATIVGTSVGFLVGLVVNYILSIAFVFNEKGNSKSAKGFVVFTALSVVGLGINILGTYIGFDLLKLNQWLVKIIMILVVLVYNYISKKLVLFKNKKSKDENIKPRNDKTKQK